MVFDRFPQMKQGRGRHLWTRGYYVSTVGINKDVIREYNDEMAQINLKQDDFRGEWNYRISPNNRIIS